MNIFGHNQQPNVIRLQGTTPIEAAREVPLIQSILDAGLASVENAAPTPVADLPPLQVPEHLRQEPYRG